MQYLFYFMLLRQDQILRMAEENGSLKQNLLSTSAAHGASKTGLRVGVHL